MTIRFHCDNPGCKRGISAPNDAAGKKVRCPTCEKLLTVPVPKKTYDLADTDTPADEAGTSTCAVCGTRYPSGASCPRCRKYRYAAASGGFDKGKLITFGFLVGVFAMLMVGAYFVIQMFAHTSEQYGQALESVRERGTETGCALQLTNIYKTLETSAIAADGKFPDSISELYTPGEFHCPARDGPAYTYLPGQDQSMPGSNVLVYEAAPAHDGKCSVLHLNGAVDLLTPAEVQAAVDRTRRVIAAKGR